MSGFASLPIRIKLMLISGFASVVTLVAVSIAFVLRDAEHNRQDFYQRQLILAQAVANNTRAALAFADVQGATQALSSLSAEPSVWAAHLLTSDGAIFAHYHGESATEVGLEHEVAGQEGASSGSPINDDGKNLRIVVPVDLSNEHLGELRLVASLAELQQKTQQNWLAIGLMSLLASVLAAVLADFLLQRSVSTRILALAGAADRVRSGEDWSLGDEVNDLGRDEIGQLGVGFAEMMAQLKRRNHTLRESEQRYRTLVEAAPLAIYELSRRGELLATNAAGLALVELTDEQRLLGENLWGYLTPAQGEAESVWQQIMQGKAMHFDGEIQAQGSVIPVSAHLVPLHDEDKGDIRVIGLLQDISERQFYEQRIRHGQKMEAVGQLTGGIAHDFNNILGVLIGNLQLMRERSDLDPKMTKRLDAMERASQRAVALTQQLLGFTRKKPQKSVSVEINGVIRGMENLIGRSLTPNVEMEYVLADALWSTEIDQGDFEDALLNLVLNARDAVDGKGRVMVETGNLVVSEEMARRIDPKMAPGEYVQLVVSDDGSGIDPQRLERIFEPFYTTKPTGKGTGLGLAMVFGFVERSGGKIKVYSELGSGTSMRIYLPKASAEQAETALPQAVAVAPGSHEERVLVVDDEPDLLELAAEQLQQMGYQILMANNGYEALDLLAQNTDIDLVFSDVVMPEMSGYELAATIAQRYPAVKLLLASGFTERASKNGKNGDRDEAYPLLSKPYSATTLAKMVREILDTA